MAIELNARLSAYTKTSNGRTPTPTPIDVHLYQHCLIVNGFFGDIPQGESFAEYAITIITNVYLSTDTKITEDNIKDLLYTNRASDMENMNLVVYNGVSKIQKDGEADTITGGSICIIEDEDNVKQLYYFDLDKGPLQNQPNLTPIIADTIVQII